MLNTYREAGGATISQPKTEVLWVVERASLNWLKEVNWKIQEDERIIRHLGLPIGMNINTRQAWEWM
eukprot:c29680_g1_i1 orf=1-198(-)